MQRIPNIAENMFASKDEFKFGLRGLRKLFFPHFPGWLAGSFEILSSSWTLKKEA